MVIESFWWWTDKQKEFAKDVDAFVETHIQETEEAYWAKRFPYKVLEKVAEKRFMGAGVPPEYGGLDIGATGCCIVAEGLGRLYAVGHVFVVSMLGGLHQLLMFGTEEQKKKYLEQIAEGKVLGAVCITEPFAGSDAANVYTTATQEGDKWILNGKKRMITGAGVAGRYFIYAKTSDDPEERRQYRHITAFVVDRGMKGFTLEKINALVGFDNVPNGYLDFDNVELTEANRVGGVGQGWQVMMSGLNFERLIGAAVVGGGLSDIIKILAHYMERRVQFNSQISRFTNLQFDFADIVQKYYIARLITYHSAYLLDHTKELKLTEFETGTWASIAKLYNTESARWVGSTAVQITGGDGLCRFYPIERLVREAKIGEIVAGTSEVQKMIIYRMTQQKRGFLELKHYFKIHPEMGVPIITMEPSPWEGKEVNKENILKILAEDFKTNPGLYMTPDDVKDRIKGNKKLIGEVLEELEKEGSIVTLRHPRTQKLLLAKANYQGLRKAYPKEFYRWFPDWVKEDEFMMQMTKF
ncbi:MAG TPA: acyl-CoA dehydrogenase family protein [Candidatus Deferrimicrobium sp.]|nr:acyl-CoA dehydrogenase family protein [Candidatus Deferrimicrobium sp.]